MFKIFACAFFLLSGCQESLEDLTEEFYTEAAARKCFPPRMPIVLGTLPDPAVGMCMWNLMMVIDEASFERFGPFEKREVVYHELGHCVLNRQHIDDPKSLMTPSMHSEVYLRKNFDIMVDELFSTCRGDK